MIFSLNWGKTYNLSLVSMKLKNKIIVYCFMSVLSLSFFNPIELNCGVNFSKSLPRERSKIEIINGDDWAKYKCCTVVENGYAIGFDMQVESVSGNFIGQINAFGLGFNNVKEDVLHSILLLKENSQLMIDNTRKLFMDLIIKYRKNKNIFIKWYDVGINENL